MTVWAPTGATAERLDRLPRAGGGFRLGGVDECSERTFFTVLCRVFDAQVVE